MEPGEGRSCSLVAPELQGGLLVRPGWTGQGAEELERLQERSPQGPPCRLLTVQEEGPLSGRLPLHYRRNQGAADRKHVQLPRIGVLKTHCRHPSPGRSL